MQKQQDLKKKVKVKFAGEPGLDMGGLTKEWFLLLVRNIFQTEYGELQMLMVQLYSHNASKANLYRKQESSNIATRHLKSPTYYRVAVEIQQFGDQCSSNNVLQMVSIWTLTYNIASYCCFQNERTASMHRWHAIMVCISRGTTSLLIRCSVVYQAIPETGLAQ